MAGERKGKTYEAILKVALDRLKSAGKIKGEIFWNKTPKGMTIEPDFTIGKDEDHPSHLMLVTHSGSAKNSDMKFWRNMGELAEAKLLLATVPRVFNVAFDSVIKEDLKKIQAVAFDGQLIVGDLKYGKALQQWVDANHAVLPTKAEEKAENIKKLAESDNIIKDLLTKLGTDLEATLKHTQLELDQLWTMDRKRNSGRVPAAKNTYIRRGLGKLLLLGSDFTKLVGKNGKLSASVPLAILESLIKVGIAKRTLTGYVISDPEALWVVSNIPTERLSEIVAVQPFASISVLADPLLSLGALPKQLSFISSHWAELITARGLFEHLNIVHTNPAAISTEFILADSKWVWLFHILIEWIKLNAGTRTAYGLARLIADLEQAATDKIHREVVEDICLGSCEWRAGSTIGLGLSDWHSRPSKQHFPLYEDDLARVAAVLAERLAHCSKPSASDEVRLCEAIIQANLENKLLTYREFQPVGAAVSAALGAVGVTGFRVPFAESCFAQSVKARGQRLDPRSSGTSVLQVKHTFINWQSVSDAGRDHKKKELCGRAVGLRYSWDTKTNKFTPRPGIKKLILVVDGTWRQEDLDTLIRAGWDEIFYPDDMDKLPEAIV